MEATAVRACNGMVAIRRRDVRGGQIGGWSGGASWRRIMIDEIKYGGNTVA